MSKLKRFEFVSNYVIVMKSFIAFSKLTETTTDMLSYRARTGFCRKTGDCTLTASHSHLPGSLRKP